MNMSRVIFLSSLVATAFAVERVDFLAKVKLGQMGRFISETSGYIQNVGPFTTAFGDFVKFKASSRIEGFLHTLDSVEYVEREQILHVMGANGNGPKADNHYKTELYYKQWALKNIGRNVGYIPFGRVGVDINAEKAWTISKGDRRVKIAVIDSGVDYAHPDLQENMWVNEAELAGQEGVDDDGNGFIDDIHGYDFYNNDGDPQDDNGHGTNCAGLIASGHNRWGTVGVMSSVQIIAIKFIGRKGKGTTTNAIRSIDYAIKTGVHVMSSSWAGYIIPENASLAFQDALRAAGERGIVFVSGAGNNSRDNDEYPLYPGNYDIDNIIVVGSIGALGRKARGSNYGATTVDIFAPGVHIYTTFRKGGYNVAYGSSMSTAYVAGTIGLLIAWQMKNSEPFLGPREIKERLIETSVRERVLEGKGVGGRVDAYAFLKGVFSEESPLL